MPRKNTKKIMRGGSNAEEKAAAVLGSNELPTEEPAAEEPAAEEPAAEEPEKK